MNYIPTCIQSTESNQIPTKIKRKVKEYLLVFTSHVILIIYNEIYY